MKQLLYILSMLLLIACNKTDKTEVAESTTPIKPSKPAIIDYVPLEGNKSHIDSLFKYANEEEISIFVRQKGEEHLQQVVAKHIPGNVEAGYNVFRDNMGNVIRIAENPDSGDDGLFISCTHYFDENGKTFAFERKINSFNCYCTDGVLFETKITYYDPAFKVIGKTYKLIDENEIEMVKDSCRLVEYNYTVQPDVATYISNKSIPAKVK